MNLLLGLILGVLLTIGTAFIADAFSTSERLAQGSKPAKPTGVARRSVH